MGDDRTLTLKDRAIALRLVEEKLIFISDSEMSHLVETAYPDQVIQERVRLVAEEKGYPLHRIGWILNSSRFKELSIKSLYLGLSDGARTNELRRASKGEINNEQIWHAYELSEEKAGDMAESLAKALSALGMAVENPRFNIIWLLDDFSGSGNTYIRYDSKVQKYKGKIKKIYERLSRGDLIDTSHYEVYLLLYVATRQAIDHIEYWSERFTSEYGYKPLQLKVLHLIETEYSLKSMPDEEIIKVISDEKYYDKRVEDENTDVGGTKDIKLGFAGCALPIVLSHNTPNNSVYVLWGYEYLKFGGLFPRVSRHKEF